MFGFHTVNVYTGQEHDMTPDRYHAILCALTLLLGLRYWRTARRLERVRAKLRLHRAMVRDVEGALPDASARTSRP